MSTLAWLFLQAGVVQMDARIMAPILPAVAGSLGVSAGEAGLSMTAYSVSYGLMQVVYGPLSDRHGRLRVIRVTAVLFALGTAVSGLTPTLGAFVAARLVVGAFAAATVPTTFAYIGDTVAYERRQGVITRFAAILNGAQAMSAALAAVGTHLVSWRLLFETYAVLALVPALRLGRAPEAPRAGATAAARPVSYAAILRLRRARRLFGLVFVEGTFVWGGATYMGVLARERFGWNDLQIGLLVACYGLGTVVAGLTVGRVAGNLGERRLALAGGLAQAAGFGVLALPLPWPVFAVSLGLIGAGLTGLHSTLQTRATELLPAARGKAFAFFPLSFFLGGAAGSAALGWLVDAGLAGAAMAVCGLGLAAVGALTAR